MAPWFGWALAVCAVAGGYAAYGWPGVLLAVTMTVFWLLLQFSRALRVLRAAGAAPVGHVASAVMLNAKLHTGMRLVQVLALTRSLGRKLAEEPNERFEWRDAGGDAVEVHLERGEVVSWRLSRVGAEAQGR
jgi:hypothetical protein